MVKVKEMTDDKKYAMVVDSINFLNSFVPAFVKKHLGEQAANELQRTWQEGIKPVPEDASFKKKYEDAYGNWIWMGKNEFIFIRNQMGEEGIRRFERAEVEALKRKNAGPALLFLNIVRSISPRTAFTMTAKEFAYQLQWITPFSVPEMTQSKAVFNIPHCKILDFKDPDDICLIGCQRIYPAWAAEQFKVNMKFERQGNDCTCQLTPLMS